MIRLASVEDAPALAALLNEIIAIGGTTAYETPFTPTDFVEHYLTAPANTCCHIAERHGQALGFQALGPWPGLPEGWLDIGTFVAPSARGSGAGRALFEATRREARQVGCTTINAVIRADNRLGLGYYARMGFFDYGAEPEFRLKDGRRVGRILKRFDLV